jgi:hypothetical protein
MPRSARSFCRPRLPADVGGLASKLPALGFEPSLVLRLHGGMEPSGDVPAERATERASLTDAFGRATAPESERVVNPRNQRHSGSLRPFRQTLVGGRPVRRQDQLMRLCRACAPRPPDQRHHSKELKPPGPAVELGSNQRGRQVILGRGRNFRGASTFSPSFLLLGLCGRGQTKRRWSTITLATKARVSA